MEKKGVNYLLLVVLCAAMFLENKESVHAAVAENIAYGKSVWVSSSESGSYGGNKAVDANGKLFAIGECDKLPTSNELRNQNEWAFVMSWAELTFSYNSNSEIQNLYWADNVLVQNELPNF